MLLLDSNLYQIKFFNYADGHISAQISINETHPIFKGHFPGQPVLPGVCMLQISQELIEKALGQKLFMTHTGQVKFLKITDPMVQHLLDINISLNESLEHVSIIWKDSDQAITLKYTASYSLMS